MATGFWHRLATVVSAEPFPHGTGTLRCLQKEMATYRLWSVSLWRDPEDVPHCRILSPEKNWMAAYLGYTLRMKTFRGWPIMIHDMHTRRRRRNTITSYSSMCLWITSCRKNLTKAKNNITPCYVNVPSKAEDSQLCLYICICYYSFILSFYHLKMLAPFLQHDSKEY